MTKLIREKGSRRDFISTGLQTMLAVQAAPAVVGQNARKIYRAVVIGRTGAGDYGHGYDTIFKGHENIVIEAIADHDAEGLRKAAERSGAKRQYLDFREMLEKEKPDLVSIAPRLPDLHKEMALAAIEVGAHIYMEKPFTEHLDEADAIIDAAKKKNIKIGVGHTRRFSSEHQKMKRLIEEGFVGTILDYRVQGKQDSRAGGEDLIVLGSHDFDMMRFFLGDPLWCFGSVSIKGEPMTKKDIRKGSEPILLAGDTIRVMFQFKNNMNASWISVTAKDGWNTPNLGREHWSFTIHGSKRTIAYQSGLSAGYLDSPYLLHKDNKATWRDLPAPQNWPPPKHESGPVQNLIWAIENDQQPLCNGEDGRWAIEMVSAIYESERVDGRVRLPLSHRGNPLLRF